MLENAKLKTDIEELKKLLLDKEKRRGGTWSLTPGHVGHFVFFFYCLSFRKTLMMLIFLLSKEGVCMCVLSLTFDVICCSLKIRLVLRYQWSDRECFFTWAHYNQISLVCTVNTRWAVRIAIRVMETWPGLSEDVEEMHINTLTLKGKQLGDREIWAVWGAGKKKIIRRIWEISLNSSGNKYCS